MSLTQSLQPPDRGFSGKGIVAALFLLLLVLRTPFILTHHVQEDAYISWRCARNLATTGCYGFNPPERVSASTTHTYVLLSAVVIKLFGDHFVPVIQVLNTCMLLIATYLISREFFADRTRALLLWLMASLLPVALVISYAGMETALLMLLFAVALRWGRCGTRMACMTASAALFLMPWTRPDAVVYGGLLLIYFTDRRRRIPWINGIALTLGVATLALFNWLYFGNPLQQTIIAKSVAYHPSRQIGVIIPRAVDLFLGFGKSPGLLVPLATAHARLLGSAAMLLFIAIAGFHGYVSWRRGGPWRVTVLFVAIGLAIPAMYAVGGIVFAWYLWPAALCAFFVILAGVIDFLSSRGQRVRRGGFSIVLVFICAMMAAEWCLAVNWGTQEGGYRASIGRDLGRRVAGGDAIFLEPAGYIPFFSGCYTYDEIGLVAPKVTDYRRRFGDDWFINFLRDVQPAYVIQRRPFLTESTLDGGGRLTSDQRVWFDAHYFRVMKFDYEPAEFHSSPLILRICRMGHAIGYDVYQRHVP